MSGDTKAPGTAPNVSSLRLLSTLGGAGAAAGLLIVLVFQFTLPTVQANRAARIETAIQQVLPGIARHETLYLLNDALVATLPAGVDGRKLPKVYPGFDSNGKLIGLAIPTSEPGFQDAIDMIFGFDPSKPGTLGLVILASRETPGLGDKIEAPAFLEQFTTRQTPLRPVKAGNSQGTEDVDMVTGATISSRTVVNAINKAVARWEPVIKSWRAGAGS